MAIHTVAAGAPILASDINALVTALTPSPVTTTATIGTVASGFSVVDVRACTMADGKLVSVDLFCSVTTAVTSAGNGNIIDTLMFTLATAYRPSHQVQASYDASGATEGSATIATDGTVKLRTTNTPVATGGAALAVGNNVIVSATFQVG